MRNLFLIIFCVVAVFLQMSVAGVFLSEERIPDLSLALAITLVLALGFDESFWWVLLVGILIDAGSSSVFGTTTLAYFLIVWIVSWIVDIADIRSRKTFFLAVLAVFVAIAEVVKDLFVFGGLKIKSIYFHGPFSATIDIFSVDYLFKIIYTIIAAYIIYYVFRRTSRAYFSEPARLAKKAY